MSKKDKLVTPDTKEVIELRTILEWKKPHYDNPSLRITLIEGGIELDFSKMYDAPPLSFKMLKALSEHFGTDKIDVDDYSNGGCETCDYGSSYGHRIQVLSPTKNIPTDLPIEIK